MAKLGKRYEAVCSTPGKQNFVQPYMWIGIEDPDGKGQWREMYSKTPIDFAPWDRVNCLVDSVTRCLNIQLLECIQKLSKSNHSSVFLFYEIAHIWSPFVGKIFPKNFQKSPNLVTLSVGFCV